MATRIAVATRWIENRDQVHRGALTLNRHLDDLVDETADRTERHQPTRPAVQHEQHRDDRGAKQVLDRTAREVGQGHPVGERAPGDLLNRTLDRDIEPSSGDAAENESSDDSKEQKPNKRQGSQASTLCSAGCTRPDLLRSPVLHRGFADADAHRDVPLARNMAVMLNASSTDRDCIGHNPSR
jgi:hypothetical protein